MGLSYRQIKYLHAIGVFKDLPGAVTSKSSGSTTPKKKRVTTVTPREKLRPVPELTESEWGKMSSPARNAYHQSQIQRVSFNSPMPIYLRHGLRANTPQGQKMAREWRDAKVDKIEIEIDDQLAKNPKATGRTARDNIVLSVLQKAAGTHSPVSKLRRSFQGSLPPTNHSKAQFKDAADWVDSVRGSSTRGIRVGLGDPVPSGRAYALVEDSTVHLHPKNDVRTYVHEIAHVLEHHTPEIAKLSREYIAENFDSKLEKLSKLTGNKTYADSEKARIPKPKGEVLSPYVGKTYSRSVSEVTSMGLEHLYHSPSELMVKYPKLFTQVLRMLHS